MVISRIYGTRGQAGKRGKCGKLRKGWRERDWQREAGQDGQRDARKSWKIRK